MRIQFNDGQEILFQDLNKILQLAERNLHDRVLSNLCEGEDGVFKDSFKVTFVDSTHTSVQAGLGIQTDNTQVSPEPIKRLLYKAAATTMTHAAPNPTNNRIDLVCIRANRVTTLTESRQVKDAVSSVIAPQTLTVETDWSSDLLVVAGTPAPSPVAPAVPSGYVKLCEVLVTAVTGISGSGAITDSRLLLPVNAEANIDTSGFANVPTKAIGTPLKTVLSELDVLGAASAQVLSIYDAIVGAQAFCTHASLAAALSDFPSGNCQILVVDDLTLNAAVAVSVPNVSIHVKNGKTISKGTATTGIDVSADGFEFRGRIGGFSATGDKAINFQAGADYCSVYGSRFFNNDTDVDDSLVAVSQFGNINE